ncbi:LysR family transcriptional regulator [Comamonas thiooxydans]|uniref:LysR family transcriptional regulator n=1 Tax=Comamonas thiooxydans TaxID=363952 RepID=UPI00050F8D9D|nr:LysR family transcriptional regulator [Comamonas thiooxydans]GAO72898.1 LysR family transcriptional regulator [Comamonas sp. E6]KGG87716.1 LysR family transcriptional regulator [Comamonas thiooxydans]KGG96537.1 LysR family transcriptional regulator [Comamonas thiooxydans]KGG99114.1 LysR family transcriptional regulator [Comamonas thiooxydans]KGH08271.1 LysR family transcriptional regulator [Comamonas thiooxydans]
MDLRDLKYFEVIAELEHMGRAAERLHKTQPALTSCVRRLEDACGATLLEKAGRGIRLTTAGHTLLKWAQRTRFDIESAHREIGDIGQGVSGHVKLGIVPTAAQFLLPPAARDLLAEAPGVTIQTTVALGDVLAPLLRSGDIDLLVGTDAPSEPGLTSRLLAEDQLVVAAISSHELFSRPRVTLSDLTDYKWVLQPQGAPIRDWLDQTFDRHHLPRPIVQVESTMLLMLPTLIAETGLLSFISRLHLQEGSSGAGLREVKVRGATMRRRMVVTYRDSGYVSPAAQRLIALLAKHARLPVAQ